MTRKSPPKSHPWRTFAPLSQAESQREKLKREQVAPTNMLKRYIPR